ncbi:Tripartite tricarboxylate transporter family receptor [Pigmentiphaga humi]|uniref:Tripartite tricarboxylate transporter family receptor n=1 Tax=Pigmentiphaga humi TaxID=2478468 RepID=A0A3P4B4P9_9BURK|nr:tripartite tricarboxylate transporter substrate binding protein [Pigmentiphaga humi]VCU70911.1 Tripartite tricarboxylate transporter family receptor [Pigmentiphaga humi]
MKSLGRSFVVAMGMCLSAGAAVAAYPERPIRLIVPFAPGGVADATARLIAMELSSSLGQSVIVENRAGGAAIIGTSAVAKAAPDGYTLLLGSTNISTNPALYKKLPYDTDKDLAPVALAVVVPGVIVTHPSVPARNMSELAAYARKHPDKLSYASVGIGSFSHLAVERLGQQMSISMVHVPYKGYAPAVMSVMSGESDLLISDLQGALSYVKSGKLNALAVTGVKRLDVLPDVPTAQEQGIKQYEAVGWLGVMAPRGTPPEIIARLNAEINKAMGKPDTAKRYVEQGSETFNGGPDAFQRFLDDNRKGWEQVIRAANIRVDEP